MVLSVGPITCDQVFDQFVLTSESPTTFVTLEWFLSQMYQCVLIQVTFLLEIFITIITLVPVCQTELFRERLLEVDIEATIMDAFGGDFLGELVSDEHLSSSLFMNFFPNN